MSEKCPCCSGMQYSLCCEPWLNGTAIPSTAAQLMRSRYTAYVKQDAAYLVATWHSSARHAQLQSMLAESFANTHWLGLTVIAQEAGRDDNESYVTFFARFTDNQHPSAIHERSRFLRDDQRWYYIDGTAPQVGRNDRCPCGSEKKYKKCCGQ
ncbi:YchJ family protein [Pantoea sp. B65]|uniref:YchJ family protein n=1 Tax=Pantoea sp. B65 TaxID=2813359 RepID=UPI0039B48179